MLTSLTLTILQTGQFGQFWVLLWLSNVISKINKRIEQFASITPDLYWELRCGLLQLRLILSCHWLDFRRQNTSCSRFYPAANSNSGGWIQVAAVSSSGGWIQVTADSILLLTPVPAAGYELGLILSCGWLWVAADSSFGGSIWVTADSILWLTISWGWFYPAAVSSSAEWTRLATGL